MLFTPSYMCGKMIAKIVGDLGHKSFHGNSCSVYVDMMEII